MHNKDLHNKLDLKYYSDGKRPREVSDKMWEQILRKLFFCTFGMHTFVLLKLYTYNTYQDIDKEEGIKC